MTDPKKQAEADKAKVEKEAEQRSRDQAAADKAKAEADKKAEADAEKKANQPVSSADLKAASEDTMPTLGGPRVASSQEIREERAAQEVGAAPYPADPREAHARAAALSKATGPAPEFRTSDIERGATGEKLYPIRLLNDWWDGQGLRHPRGDVVEVPFNEAKRLVGEKKAERADAWE